jgi:hypothetical protein
MGTDSGQVTQLLKAMLVLDKHASSKPSGRTPRP